MIRSFVRLRRIQLRVFYFNRLCSWIAYALKLVCISVRIVGIFFSIKLWHGHGIIAGVSGCFGGSMGCCYIVLYSGGSKLPSRLRVCKMELLEPQKKLLKSTRMILTRQVRSLGSLEVSMGGFYALKRSSTIDFFHFAFSNICTLIIAFPGSL